MVKITPQLILLAAVSFLIVPTSLALAAPLTPNRSGQTTKPGVPSPVLPRADAHTLTNAAQNLEPRARTKPVNHGNNKALKAAAYPNKNVQGKITKKPASRKRRRLPPLTTPVWGGTDAPLRAIRPMPPGPPPPPPPADTGRRREASPIEMVTESPQRWEAEWPSSKNDDEARPSPKPTQEAAPRRAAAPTLDWMKSKSSALDHALWPSRRLGVSDKQPPKMSYKLKHGSTPSALNPGTRPSSQLPEGEI